MAKSKTKELPNVDLNHYATFDQRIRAARKLAVEKCKKRKDGIIQCPARYCHGYGY